MNFKNNQRDNHRHRRQHEEPRRDRGRSGTVDKMMIDRRHSSPGRLRRSSRSRSHRQSRSRHRHRDRRHRHYKSRSASPSRKHHKRQRRDRPRRGQDGGQWSSSSSWHPSRSKSPRNGRRGDHNGMDRRERRNRRQNGAHNRNRGADADGHGSVSPACIVSDDSDGNNDTGLHRKRRRDSAKLLENKHPGEGKWWGEDWTEGKCGVYPKNRSPSKSLSSSSIDSYNRRRTTKKQHDSKKNHSRSPREERKGRRRGRATFRRSHSSDDNHQSSKSPGRGRGDNDRNQNRRAKSYSPKRKNENRRERRRESHCSGSRDEHSGSSRDDTIGHFKGGPGTVIGGRYRIIRDVGLGTFGRVVECSRGDTARVAIKIVRNVRRYYDSALIEADICERVNREQTRQRKDLCAKMLDRFDLPTGHYCLVFERLGRSLYDFLKAHNYRPFPMFCVRDFSRQLLEALDFLHGFGLIHTDLKPENILLCQDDRGSTHSVPACTQVKVIDFGGATFDNEKKSSIVNTRQYRAPEVILGWGWSYPSDLWSAGCIISELYTGRLLFQTHDNTEHLALIEHAVGKFRRDLLDRSKSPLARECFDSRGWHRLRGVLSSRSAAYVRKTKPIERMVSDHDRDRSSGFVELLRSLLTIDPAKRATARQALDSRFFA
ncbi:hypothetical protein ACHAWX_003205 [Stephanocyclus meneghinianus]